MFFNKKIIKLGVNAKSDTEIINILADALKQQNIIKPDYLKHVLAREEEYPTGFPLEDGIGVAIPHTDSKYVNESQIAVVTLKKPVVFKNMVDATKKVKVNLVFMIAMNQPHEQAKLLSNLMAFCQNKKAVQELMASPNVEAAYSTLRKYKLD